MLDVPGRTEANRLYWETDASVAEIGDRLGISRRALYDAIEARPAGAVCPQCGDELVVRNRTAASRGAAECVGCGAEVTVGDAAPADAPEPQVEQEGAAARLSPGGRGADAAQGHAAIIGAALLGGLAAGAVTGYLLRRR
jgi:ribosomal protein L37AE/L43A